MALSKENLQQLIALQQQDAALDKIKSAIDKIPVMIARLNEQLAADKVRAGEAKNKTISLEKRKKDKELELAQKEEAAKKHGAELNQVKTNEAFRALQTEIERAKAAASQIETEILEIMEQLDGSKKDEKIAQASFQAEEKKFQAEIALMEGKLAEQKTLFDGEKTKRDEAAAPIPADAMKIYNHIRSRGKLDAIVPIDSSNSCSACRIQLAPQVIVEATKAKNLVSCESCQRILYRPEALVAKAAS